MSDGGPTVLRGIVVLAIGLVLGVVLGRAWPDGAERPSDGPWLARVGDQVIRPADFIDEMERRGGRQAGTYRSLDQKRLLLNEMIVRASLADSARREGYDEEPEVRRAMDAVLINRYRQDRLQPLRDGIRISDEDVQRYYEEHAGDYVVPERKRLAIIQFEVPEGAADERWDNAMAQAAEVLDSVEQLDLPVPHFGDLARQHSDHQGSRYRGGVIGWVSEGGMRPRFNPTVSEAAEELDSPGEIAGPLRADDGVYLVRLVEDEPRRERSLEELSAGIRQRLLAERLRRVETEFLDARLAEAETEINEEALRDIDPLSPPRSERTGPPRGPTRTEDES
ncbi:MAG: peptidyl-prolyl cis-trans isomerase [Wenzhouxiangellaceae bacterium]|nr:peptidyl-prolyl cis-trans isomerase [Wenzhouxiangellaceae bacterium]